MAQGKRGRWVRVAATGLGVLLCTGLVGCMNNDKPKGIQKAPVGLPGTATLPANNTGAMNGRTGAQNQFTGQGGASPAAGLGAGQQRFGNTGTSNFNGGVQPTNFNTFGANPGQPGTVGTPAMNGIQPAGGFGGPLGAAPSNANRGVAALSPAPPSLDSMPLPPPAPGDSYAPLPPASSGTAPQQYSRGSASGQ
jgi:hypothetical protein